MNGVLVINKPKDYTSRDIVNIVGKELVTTKIGHTGTLDPLATGVLVLPIGRALKISEMLTAERKEYIADVILGYETDTLDVTGTIINKNNPTLTVDKLKEVLGSFKGKSMQEVPMYSAVKVKGKKLYEYARNGIKVIPPSKEIEVYSIDLISDIITLEDTIEFTIKCEVSKGTYIRSLIRDIGYKLGTYGTMKELTRTKQGIFTINNSYTIEDIKEGNYKLLSIREALPNIKVTKVDDKLLKKIKNGMKVDKFFGGDMSLIVDKNNKEIAIYKNIDNNMAKLYKMIEVDNNE